jgi:hypothetical protein
MSRGTESRGAYLICGCELLFSDGKLEISLTDFLSVEFQSIISGHGLSAQHIDKYVYVLYQNAIALFPSADAALHPIIHLDFALLDQFKSCCDRG